MADLTTIADLGTAGGTLVLAAATFASIRSANRSARIADEALQQGLRPLVMATRLQDPPERCHFVDGHWMTLDGGEGRVEFGTDVAYLAMALRNVGTGLAVLQSWSVQIVEPGNLPGPYGDPSRFRRLGRDLYLPAGDQGFWQGAIRNPDDPDLARLREAVEQSWTVFVDLLYGDHRGGQRVISRFGMLPVEAGRRTISVARHWNLDRPDPR